MKRITALAVLATALMGTACGDDDKTSINVPDNNDITLPGGDDIDLPDGVTLPPNVSEDCMAITLEFAQLMGQIYTPTGEDVNYDEVFGNLSDRVPEDLRDDMQVMGDAYAGYAGVLQEYNNNYSAPEVQAASEVFNTPEVQAASDNLTAYFEAQCPDS